jgi:hypothetical protein
MTKPPPWKYTRPGNTGVGRGAGRPVASAGNRAARSGNGQVAHLAHRGFGGLGEEAALAIGCAGLLRTHFVNRGQAALFDQLQQGLGLHIEHGVSAPEVMENREDSAD